LRSSTNTLLVVGVFDNSGTGFHPIALDHSEFAFVLSPIGTE